MYLTLFNLCLIILTLLTTFASATHIDIFDRATANATIPGGIPNATISSNTAVDTSKWVITYCNKPHGPVTGACRGDCTTWNVGKKGNDGIGDTPDTNCVYTSPPFQVSFKVCAGPTEWYHCHWNDSFHPWLYPYGDENGVSVYNTISTASIDIGPRLS
jgi:hypothetical protein